MESHEIQVVLKDALSLQFVYVTGDGGNFKIIAVDQIFNGMTPVKKQKTIYAPLAKYIEDKRIHALSIQVYTPKEWECARKLHGL